MGRFLFWALVPLLSQFTGVDGYKIDADCGGDHDLVKAGVDAAFALASEAHSQLNSLRNPEIGYVFDQLFGRGIGDRGNDKLVESKLERLAAISALNQPLGESVAEVTFFCTTNRIEQRKDGKFYNKDRNYVYPKAEITDKFASCRDMRSPTLMITTNPLVDPKIGSEIQICPWYLMQEKKFKFKSFLDLDWKQMLLGGYAKVRMNDVARKKYAPIDNFTLFPKVILHELTHTRQSGGTRQGVAKDMGDTPYGWNGCKTLAQIFRGAGFAAGLDPQQNADSIALFCSAVSLIGKGIRIKDNGDLEPQQNSQRRDIVMYPVTWAA